ncbi:hypothetical protein HFO91_30375 [Rhizobium leguminosarum]|uniref:hypothetical protein n=1 Tax=Rhizobium leguminosarum TaxID=384 RepID=UPI001C982730|nr:hypothetical protein [Rhizobium leguminosarum]MBY5453886.1 hypothetical protein [Rhizobium leguminosarum]
MFIVHDGSQAIEVAAYLASNKPDVPRYREAQQDIEAAILSLKSAKAKLEADGNDMSAYGSGNVFADLGLDNPAELLAETEKAVEERRKPSFLKREGHDD